MILMFYVFQIDVLPELKPAVKSKKLDDQDLSVDFKKMFETSAFSDFELKSSDDVVFKVHKSVLSVRSPVFFAMLSNEMKEAKENAAKIPNIDGATLKELLRYIYCNRVEDFPEVVEELVQAAEQYQLEKLKHLCFDFLIEQLSVENVIVYFQIADHISDASLLFDECMNMIIK